MSTGMSQTPSEACCNTPVAIVKDYQEKGTYIEVDGLKTYTTGSATAKYGLLIVYDIFGFYPQTIQGADILAYADKGHEYQVFMPDFWEGSPADLSWFPPDTEEKGKKLGELFKRPEAGAKTVGRIPKIIQHLSSTYTEITKWGILGFCWGGKIVNLSSQASTPFTSAAAAHPAMIDPADAQKLSIPILLLPSKDEDAKAVEEYESKLSVKHLVKTYPDQIHGWMAARGDLNDPKVKQAYEDGYKTVLDWFHQTIS